MTKAKKQLHPPRYFGKRALKRISQMPIPVKVESALSERNPLGIYDLGTIMYIQGLKTSDSNENRTANTREDEIKQKNAEFNQKLKQEPQNIQLWLNFIEFQDTPEAQRLVTNENGNSINIDLKGRQIHLRALLERKISILDKAIEMNPKSIRLITLKLQIASEFWESGKLQQEWRNTLFVHPMAIDLWNKYLSFIENYFEGFTVSSVLKAYSTCIHKMIQMQHPSFTSHQRPDNLAEYMIGNFL